VPAGRRSLPGPHQRRCTHWRLRRRRRAADQPIHAPSPATPWSGPARAWTTRPRPTHGPTPQIIGLRGTTGRWRGASLIRGTNAAAQFAGTRLAPQRPTAEFGTQPPTALPRHCRNGPRGTAGRRRTLGSSPAVPRHAGNAELPDCRTAGLPDCRTAGNAGVPQATLPGCAGLRRTLLGTTRRARHRAAASPPIPSCRIHSVTAPGPERTRPAGSGTRSTPHRRRGRRSCIDSCRYDRHSQAADGWQAWADRTPRATKAPQRSRNPQREAVEVEAGLPDARRAPGVSVAMTASLGPNAGSPEFSERAGQAAQAGRAAQQPRTRGRSEGRRRRSR
jgi:hypothetical protein